MSGILLAILIEAALLLVLLSLGVATVTPHEEQEITVVSLPAPMAEAEPKQGEQPREQAAEPRTEPPSPEPLPPQPAPTQPTPALPTPPVAAPSPLPAPVLAPAPPSAASTAPSRPAQPRRVYGPPALAGSSSRDTPIVGSAPNGEPLYAASWYREPTEADLRGYMSTANGPGWGLIACRTAPQYRVEDCVALDEYPAGVQINRAVLAAAWQFRVRPPQRGGVPLVGSWVRIRIDYSRR